MNSSVTSFDQLSITLKADQVAAVLGISRSNAYNLMRSEGMSTLSMVGTVAGSLFNIVLDPILSGPGRDTTGKPGFIRGRVPGQCQR